MVATKHPVQCATPFDCAQDMLIAPYDIPDFAKLRPMR